MALTPLRNLPARPDTFRTRPARNQQKEQSRVQSRGSAAAFPVAPSRCRAAGTPQCLASSLAALALASLATSRALSATFCAASAVASLACAAASVAATLALSAAFAVASAALSSACWVSAAACSEAAAVLSAALRVASGGPVHGVTGGSAGAVGGLLRVLLGLFGFRTLAGGQGQQQGGGQQRGGDRANLHGGLRYCNGWGRQPIHAVVKTGSRSERAQAAGRKAAGEPAAFPEQPEERSYYFWLLQQRPWPAQR